MLMSGINVMNLEGRPDQTNEISVLVSRRVLISGFTTVYKIYTRYPRLAVALKSPKLLTRSFNNFEGRVSTMAGGPTRFRDLV